ncbi:hypothetical protein CTI12_AA569680 [Artemisia annua]|uniref:DUF659 domain-containing protein n=1 Tax=Artemisia annua TaxID=35608 RepID=A0A2U1KSG4_ARTAN|nr:hypothetical protein CTI12_AA569680 [Artemisia annua]
MSEEFYDLVEDAQTEDVIEDESMTQTETQSQTQPSSHKDEAKPLLDEVTFVGSGNSKNPGGAKVWMCIYCNIQYTSSYSRIHMHFFGVTWGKKAEIRRCPAILADREKYIKLLKKMVSAISKAPPSYKAPSSEKARTVLLYECARDVEKDSSSIQDTWFTQGVSIVSDGWSNVKHEPLINVLVVNSRGVTFMYAKDFSGVEKIGQAISNYLLGAIEKIGPSHVLQVVTDNAANCKAAGKDIEKVYKHIFWSPCCVHTLNLIFKDFAEQFNWLENVYNRGKMVVKYFLNHSQALAIFRDNSNLEILKLASTRFASHYILLKRLKDCREALATTVVLNSWREWAKQGDENTKKWRTCCSNYTK